MNVIDLFCGVGGLSYGLSQAGLNILAGVDIDKSCEFAYTKNNNAIFINKSVSEINPFKIRKIFPDDEIKIIVGCAPCQPFSSHQKDKKNRHNHKDWGLLNDFGELVQKVMPDIVSMENVPSLINEDVFDDFVKTLRELNYYVNYQVHNSLDFGMAQNRRRLLLLASLHGEIEFADDCEKPSTVKEVIGHLEVIEAGETSKRDILHRSAGLSKTNLERIRNSTPGGTWRDWPDELLPNCYRKKTGQSYQTVYGRMEYNHFSPTLTTQFFAYGTGRFGHPEQDRAISLREGALLQSFPEDYVFVSNTERSYSLNTVARQIGNAVPPRLGLHIGRSIVNHLRKNKLI